MATRTNKIPMPYRKPSRGRVLATILSGSSLVNRLTRRSYSPRKFVKTRRPNGRNPAPIMAVPIRIHCPPMASEASPKAIVSTATPCTTRKNGEAERYQRRRAGVGRSIAVPDAFGSPLRCALIYSSARRTTSLFRFSGRELQSHPAAGAHITAGNRLPCDLPCTRKHVNGSGQVRSNARADIQKATAQVREPAHREFESLAPTRMPAKSRPRLRARR